ncbi:MAG: heterodisulfide reductase [Chloroflexi bacterium HGW-Chloroflexi-1]|nr:MAG: heterodisulfide reductase [Chloroflexi bacterium HGW-Chloroflexi-1]
MLEPRITDVISDPDNDAGSVMVVGGGVAGMRAAVDLAEAGLKVYLVEAAPALGGRVAQLGYMFPTHDCVLCRGTSDHGYGCTRPAISPAFQDKNLHPNIRLLTLTNIIAVDGQAGDFRVTLRHEPRYVDPARCISCDLCSIVCPVELPSSFQLELATRKAAYKVAVRTIPDAYVIDRGPYCDDCGRCAEVCPTQCIDLDEQPHESRVRVGAIILAVGYDLSDAGEYEELGFGRYANVIHSMQYERLASRSGPTEGLVLRPSDGKKPRRIAWLQCVGSRDQKHPYCSSICCMYATKEAMIAKERLPGVHAQVFMMDERAFNKEFNAYYEAARKKHGVEYTRARISYVKEDPATGDLILHYPDPAGKLIQDRFDLVVLSLGTAPPRSAKTLAEELGIELNEYGFCQTDKFTPLETSAPGVYVCGTFLSPKEIAETFLDAAGAAGDVMRLMSSQLGRNASSREYPFLSIGDEFPPERDVSAEPIRAGVFVCRCEPSIDGVIDTQNVAEFASTLPNVVHAERLAFGCLDPDLDRIRQAIEAHGLNRVVVAGCSPRTHESLFQRVTRQAGLNSYLLAMANIREQCAWVHESQPVLATRKAKELVRMAVNRVSLAQPVHKLHVKPTDQALIIGGGVAGMQAALSIADAGYNVTLVERQAQLGGNLRHIYYVAEGQNPQRLLRDLINRVRGHERIEVLTRSELKTHTGRTGDFRSVIVTHAGELDVETAVRHAVTIVTTGGEEWRGDIYLLGRDARVVTQLDLEEIIVHRPEKVAEFKQVVMIQCVHPPAEMEYCSRICCTNTMKNALRVKMLNPNCQVYVLYKNMITYGFREQYYTETRRRGVIFMRYDEEHMPQAGRRPDGQLEVRAWEQVFRREMILSPDLIALSPAIVPSPGTAELAKILDVPLSVEGFFQEAHLKMRPMDFMAEGIFMAGMAHYPKFIEETIINAQATAGRAITLLAKKPLYYGGPVAVVDPVKCVGCLTCVRTCPFEIPQIQADLTGVGGIIGAAYIEPALCQGCGTCTAECPAKAIQLVAYLDAQLMGETVGAWVA